MPGSGRGVGVPLEGYIVAVGGGEWGTAVGMAVACGA